MALVTEPNAPLPRLISNLGDSWSREAKHKYHNLAKAVNLTQVNLTFTGPRIHIHTWISKNSTVIHMDIHDFGCQ